MCFPRQMEETLGSINLESVRSIQKGLYVFPTTNLCPSDHGVPFQFTCALTERLRNSPVTEAASLGGNISPNQGKIFLPFLILKATPS